MSGSACTDPTRVLFVSGTPIGTATCRYRCEHLAEMLRSCGVQADVVYIGQPRVRVAHDVVVLYRVCATAEGRRFAQAARACGAVLVYSTDDVVFDAEEAPPQMGKRFRALAPLHLEMLAQSDAALASTDCLADLMRRAAPETPVHTIRNFLNKDLITFSECARGSRESLSEAQRVTLGYLSGSRTHNEDFAAAADPIRRVLEANEEAELLIVGPLELPGSLKVREAAGQVRRLPSVEWKRLPGLIAEQRVSINLAPLNLTRRFCHAKSEVKYLEAAAVGIPTVASSGKGFQEAIPSPCGKEGCFLAADPEDWERALNFLIQQRAEAGDYGLRAYQHVHTVATADANRASVESIFRTFADLRSAGIPRRGVQTLVNWPFSPRYALKGALERGDKLRAALSVPGQRRQQAR